jgi:hypothetical protein
VDELEEFEHLQTDQNGGLEGEFVATFAEHFLEGGT